MEQVVNESESLTDTLLTSLMDKIGSKMDNIGRKLEDNGEKPKAEAIYQATTLYVSSTSISTVMLSPKTSISIPEKINQVIMGLPAHDAVFIFVALLTGRFKSSVFSIFENVLFVFITNVAMFYLHCSTYKKVEFFTSSFFHEVCSKSSSLSSSKNWHLKIFLKTCREPNYDNFLSELEPVAS